MPVPSIYVIKPDFMQKWADKIPTNRVRNIQVAEYFNIFVHNFHFSFTKILSKKVAAQKNTSL